MSSKDYPLVSCIIPFYNHNHFIKKTLDSILEDSYPSKEIVIINDGSSDPDDSNIIKWIEENSNKIKIRYIKRENKGVTKTMNELIGLAEGKYILPGASDDYLINDTITKRVEILEKHDDKLMLLSDAIVVDNNNNKIFNSVLSQLYGANKQNYNTDNSIKEEIISNWSVAGMIQLSKKELYDKVGLYNENLIVEDWEFFLRVVSKDYILFYDEIVSAYRQHETNTSNNEKQALRMHQDLYKSAIKNIKLFDGKYKNLLLEKINFYEEQIKHYKREQSFSKQFKKRTQKFRHKIKNIFKKG